MAAPFGAVLIFFLRMVDVTMATLRTIMTVRGRRVAAAVLGFFQILFWLVAVGGALEHLDSIPHVLGYAGGFAMGNYVGVWLEGRLAIGTSVVRAVIPKDPESGRAAGPRVAKVLREGEFAVTEVPARAWHGDADVFDVVVPRRKVKQVVREVEQHDPGAFISVGDIQHTRGGFPIGRELKRGGWIQQGWRKYAA